MCTVPDKQPCPRWCDYADARNHPTRHIAHLGDLIPADQTRTRVLAVTVEADLDSAAPLPVVSMLRADQAAACIARLTWSEAVRVGRLLIDAERRFA